ncbi:MAG TPA: hypothetical protein VFH06_04490 [Candidatus Saccharimonadales bacterium]|nr:hypothetical protein [Candidatus Saccharimonadales bacterium]
MSVEAMSPRMNNTRENRSVQVFGGGANTEHFGSALKGLQEIRPVELFEVRDIDPARVPHDVLYRLDEYEGRERADRALGTEAISAYLSLIPQMHVDAIKQHLRRVGKGLLGFVVVPKPAVRTISEMREVDDAIAEAEAERKANGIDADTDPLYVHEHYVVKGAWKAMREKLGEVMDVLGRLESAVVTIEEARTVEGEGRVAAFEGGALEDLGPHVISIGLDVEQAFYASKRYKNVGNATLSLERYKYADSVLPSEIETGFIVHGTTTIIDEQATIPERMHYELPFRWQGGKGLDDKKCVRLDFVDPDTSERNTVVVDLQRNSLTIPEAVEHLFEQTQFTDNGYGEVVKSGLNGDTPEGSFQDWDTARKVVKITEHIRRQDEVSPKVYARNGAVSLDALRNVNR